MCHLNARSYPKFTVSRIAALSLVSLWLAGCSNSSNPPAPVSSVNGNAPTNNSSGMLITPPPKMGTTTSAPQTPQIQPVQRPTTQPTHVQPVAEQPVQMENGRIVYNRQYGNIPKGRPPAPGLASAQASGHADYFPEYAGHPP